MSFLFWGYNKILGISELMLLFLVKLNWPEVIRKVGQYPSYGGVKGDLLLVVKQKSILTF